jgi:hypothetical protein
MARGGARPGAGRPKGSVNKRTLAIAERLERLGCDPIESMAKIALGDVPCAACKGEGSVRWPGSDTAYRCDACQGSGRDAVPIELRAKMYIELAQYVASKRKAVDHDGSSSDQLVVELVRFGD